MRGRAYSTRSLTAHSPGIDPEVSTRQSGDHGMSQQETNTIRDRLRQLIDNTSDEAERSRILLAMVQGC